MNILRSVSLPMETFISYKSFLSYQVQYISVSRVNNTYFLIQPPMPLNFSPSLCLSWQIKVWRVIFELKKEFIPWSHFWRFIGSVAYISENFSLSYHCDREDKVNFCAYPIRWVWIISSICINGISFTTVLSLYEILRNYKKRA